MILPRPQQRGYGRLRSIPYGVDGPGTHESRKPQKHGFTFQFVRGNQKRDTVGCQTRLGGILPETQTAETLCQQKTEKSKALTLLL